MACANYVANYRECTNNQEPRETIAKGNIVLIISKVLEHYYKKGMVEWKLDYHVLLSQ